MLYLGLVHFQPDQVNAQKGGVVAADALNIASTFFSNPANAVVGVIVMTEEGFSFGCDFPEGGKKVFRALRAAASRPGVLKGYSIVLCRIKYMAAGAGAGTHRGTGFQ